MAEYKIELVREECISCEACVTSCPEHFEMADDGWAHLIDSARAGSNDELDTNDLGCSKEAAEACPVNIIHIAEGGTKII